MWHEARKQERRIRGMIVDYRKRAERRQDFYEKIQADPTQFIQIHGRRCKIHLDPAVAVAGDGAAIIVPWQGQQDNLIDRFDVRAHLDFIPSVPKESEAEDVELSQDERQCNYERYRILAQNDFLNLTEEKFLHQLFLEEQFGANAQLEAERNIGKKKPQKTGATIGYSYADDTDSALGPQPFSHLMHAVNLQPPSKSEKDSGSESDSDMDMDVSIDISKLDTAQAHELNSSGRNYGMVSNDFYSFLTKDADEADALRIAREEEQEKMLLSGRKSRRERRAQKERRIASRPFSPPSYAAKEDATGSGQKADEESDSRSPSPADGNTGKITYITSFGGEDELQPHSKISINFARSGQTLGEACADANALATSSTKSTLKKGATYAQKVKENLEKLQKMNERAKRTKQRTRESQGRSRSHSRSRSRSRSRGRGGNWRSRPHSRSSSRSRRHKRTSSRSCRQRYHSTSSSNKSESSCPRSRVRSRPRRSSSYSSESHLSRKRARISQRSERTRRSRSCSRKKTIPSPKPVIAVSPSTSGAMKTVSTTTAAATTTPLISYPVQAQAPTRPTPTTATTTAVAPVLHVVEPPPPPLKRYYGRKRGDATNSSSSSSSSSSETDDKEVDKKAQQTASGPTHNSDEDDHQDKDVDTTSERSNPLPAASAPLILAGKQTGKQFSTAQAKSCPSYSNASETKVSKSHQSISSLPHRTGEITKLNRTKSTEQTIETKTKPKPDRHLNGQKNNNVPKSYKVPKHVNELSILAEADARLSSLNVSPTIESSSGFLQGYSGGSGSSSSLNLRERLKRKMQSLLNKQYKADKRAEIEKTERERQLQREREDEMRELALKLRRRQRELRHKYGTPSSSKGSSDSENPSELVKSLHKNVKRSTSRSSEHYMLTEHKTSKHSHSRIHGDESRRRSCVRSSSRERERERERKASRSRSPISSYHAHTQRRSRSRSRNRRSSSRRRRRSRSPSRGRREREPSGYEDRSGRLRHEDQYQRSKSRYDRERERRFEATSDRYSERDRPKERGRNVGEYRDRERNKPYRHHGATASSSKLPCITTNVEPSPSAGESVSSSNRSRVVISAPPKLKKLVDY